MPVHRSRVLTAVLLLCGSMTAVAAKDGAIDCAKAAQADETAICGDAALVQDDARMAALFAKAMAISGMGERGDLQDGQTAWLAERQGCGADAACLRTSYTARIGHLQTVIDAAASRGP